MLPLDDDFQPGPADVICGRGKRCFTHVGNQRFRKQVECRLAEYTKARTKDEKSHVVMMVVDEVRRNSPYGGFVKRAANGAWFEVGDGLAREKTSQAFRDCLSDRYKSSTVSRRKRRQEQRSLPKRSSVGKDRRGSLPEDLLILVNTPQEETNPWVVPGIVEKGNDKEQSSGNPTNSASTATQTRRRSSVISIFSIQEIISSDFCMDTFWDESGGVSPEGSTMESNKEDKLTCSTQDSRSDYSSKRNSLISISCILSLQEKMDDEGQSSALVDWDVLSVFDEMSAMI